MSDTTPANTPRDDALPEILQQVRAQPWRFDFLWLLRTIDRARAQTDPKAPRLGRAHTIRHDPVRLTQEAHLVFSPVSIGGVDPPAGERPPRIRIRNFGLVGPNGPMPTFLIEHICRRAAQGDHAWQAFLNVIQHRLITLFYRAWAMHSPVAQEDRPWDNPLVRDLLCLLGLAEIDEGDDAPIDPRLLVFFSGRIVPSPGSAESLEAVLSGSFGVSAKVISFQGEWMDIPPECHLKLGDSPDTGLLGQTTVVGERIWSVQQRFRVRLGPMGLADYERFLPRGESGTLASLRAWVRLIAGLGLAWDLQLVLRKEDAPGVRLGAGACLGWTTWMSSDRPERDLDDLVIAGSEQAA